MLIHVCTYICICMFMCVFIYIYVCIWIGICICTCACVCACVLICRSGPVVRVALPAKASPLIPLRFSSAALQSLLVHLGAPGPTGHPGKLGSAQLLGPQRCGHAGPRRVEEGRHLHEPDVRREAAHPPRRLALLHPRGPLQAQQARRGNLSVRGHD